MGIINRVKEIIRAIRFSGSPRLYGRYSNGAGDGEEIRIGTGLQISSGILSATVTPGPAGPNSVTSATTSNGTANLSVATITGNGSGLTGLKTRLFANQAAINAGVPDYIGQLGIKQDSNNFLQATGTNAGDWTSNFTFNDIDTGSILTDGAITCNTLKVGDNGATGTYAVAIGSGTTASGSYSFAGGLGSTAEGGLSFAFGGATALGEGSFAIGDGANASGAASYALGTDASAIHQGAHVETDSQIGSITESTMANQKTYRFANGYIFLGGKAHFAGGISGVHGPYSNDNAAAAAGVLIQELYYHPDGRVSVRRT
jgi:hypothetical protein